MSTGVKLCDTKTLITDLIIELLNYVRHDNEIIFTAPVQIHQDVLLFSTHTGAAEVTPAQ